MVYNPPKTGHIVIILDNGTTAMTGMQEHPGTGRTLDHQATGKIVFEEVARAMGVTNVVVTEGPPDFDKAVREALSKEELTLIIMRRVCRLAETKIAAYELAAGRCQ